jgi:RnfABCDGE-type electron transport complex G subunit
MDGKGIFKAIAAIFVITVVMGAALGVIYNLTKNPIDQANEKAKQEAYKAVYPDADGYNVLSDEDVGGYDTWTTLLQENGYPSDTLDEVCFATKDDSIVGIIVTVTNSDGYGGDIQMVLGVSADLQVTGLEFLSISETVGLGMKATEDDFKSQFVGSTLSKLFTYTKTGKSAENEIDALSGATITTSAVTDGVNAAASIVYTMLGGAQ